MSSKKIRTATTIFIQKQTNKQTKQNRNFLEGVVSIFQVLVSVTFTMQIYCNNPFENVIYILVYLSRLLTESLIHIGFAMFGANSNLVSRVELSSFLEHW